MDDTAGGLVQVNQDIPYRTVVATGLGIAAGAGIMLLIGQLVTSYGSRMSVAGYLLLMIFAVPLLLTYSERIEGVRARGGLYGLVRRRYGLTITFFVGWLEVAGYAAVIVLLARVIGSYGLTIYGALGGEVDVPLGWVAVGVVLLMALFVVAGVSGSRKLNTVLTYVGIAFVVAIAIASLAHSGQGTTGLSSTLRSVAPFKLSALLLSSFWGVVMIFGLRRRVITTGKQSMARAIWTVMLAFVGFGMLLSMAIVPGAGSESLARVLQVNDLSAIVYSGESIYTVLIGLFSVLIASVGLSRSLESSIEVMAQLTEDGYLPPSFNYRVHKAVLPPLLFVAVLAAALIVLMDTVVVAGMAAAFLLWATMVIHAPDILRPEPRLPRRRPIHLAFHPLFPALTLVAATVATVNLPFDALMWSLVWLAVGAVLLGAYSYKRALKRHAEDRTFADTGAVAPEAQAVVERPVEAPPAVVAFVKDLGELPGILSVGSRLAKDSGGSLVVMLIAEVPDGLTPEERRRQGQEAWRDLAEGMKETELPGEGVEVRPMVRVAHDVVHGIINAAEDLSPQYILLSPGFIAEDPGRNLEDYDAILRSASGNVVFLRGELPHGDLSHVAVFTDQGTQATVTFALARALLAQDGVLEVVHVLLPGVEEEAEEARERIASMLKEQGIDDGRMRFTVRSWPSLEDAADETSVSCDLVLLGASTNFMTRSPTFGGVNAHVFQTSRAPVAMVSKQVHIHLAWLSSLWVSLTKPLPKLTMEERDEAAATIIAGADPNVDFFFLILLSAGIATYGLLQNSGAVIIGAMLVAPLMSPIVAMAMSMVRGRVQSLGLAAQATAQGVLLAISVAAVLTFFSPIKAPTGEIMGRVSPNTLDLSIAFLSGAAGAYAMSRRSIASALPGVSIAVALVPPLAVVGYGLATADLSISVGALLLFLTNLVTIVFAASLVFIALDFLTTEKQSWGEIVRGLKINLLFLVVVLLILGWVTYKTVAEQRKLRAINDVLTQSVYAENFRPLELNIKSGRKGHTIEATLLGFDKPLTTEQVERLGNELEQAIGGSVKLDITVVPAHEGSFDIDTATATTIIEEAIRGAVAELPAGILGVEAHAATDGYEARMSVIEYEPGTVSTDMISDLESKLSQQLGSTVQIQVYAVPAEKIEGQAEPIPTVTAVAVP
jgi:uncharacterized hydrophobic protein (TIGR00271 family)